jgi:hypothetical protein
VTLQENKHLISRYPFLMPRNRFTDEVPEDYDFSYTELDSMPDGWRNAFGTQMCEDIREILLKAKYLKRYRIAQIKEKFGRIRWYDNGTPDSIYDEIGNCIKKYEEISGRTCILCGEPAVGVTRGWISPFCENHGMKLYPFEE